MIGSGINIIHPTYLKLLYHDQGSVKPKKMLPPPVRVCPGVGRGHRERGVVGEGGSILHTHTPLQSFNIAFKLRHILTCFLVSLGFTSTVTTLSTDGPQCYVTYTF